MKLVYCIPSIVSLAGMERVLVNKVNYMANNWGWDILIITTDQCRRGISFPVSEKVRHIDLAINYLQSQHKNPIIDKIVRTRNILRHKRYLKDILYCEKPDVVVSMMTGRERDWLYRLQDGSKKVLEFHFSYYMINGGKHSFINYWKQRVFLNKIKEYDRLIVLTEEDKTAWQGKGNIVVIPNALTFYPDKIADPGNKRILAIGRLVPQKGFDRLINIWAKIESSFPDWRLAIIGNGEDYLSLSKQIENLGLKNIKIQDPTEAIAGEYLSSSILVMTSRFEGFPMVLHEAMSFGLPVVSNTCQCGPKDIVRDNEDGFLIEEGNEKLFVEKLKLLMENTQLRAKMGAAARKNIYRFNSEFVMGKWRDFFNILLKE